VLARHDGSEWVTFEPPDWMPIDVAGWRLVEDEWVPVANTPWWDVSPVDEPAPFPEDEFMGGSWGETRVAADGSVWLAARLGLYDSALGGQDRPTCDFGTDGVGRFDGVTWSRYLQGYCVEVMDIATDRSVWVLATESDGRYPMLRPYVITPEAVAEAE